MLELKNLGKKLVEKAKDKVEQKVEEMELFTLRWRLV